MTSFFTMLLFVAAVIALGVFTIKLRRRNSRMFSDALSEFLKEDGNDNAAESASDEPVYTPHAEIPLDSVVIPAGEDFTEAFELLVHLARTHPDETDIRFYEPHSRSEILAFEERCGKLTDELRALYSFTDGVYTDAGSFCLYPLETVERESHYEYEWGNEEDYLVIGDMIGDGELVILDRRTGHIIANDHGEIYDHETVSDLLEYMIDLFIKGEIDDERIDRFFKE